MLVILRSVAGKYDAYERVEDKFWNRVVYVRVKNLHAIEQRRPIVTVGTV
jgi:hypothetical protein